jgi:predicted Zn-dependent peptidase
MLAGRTWGLPVALGIAHRRVYERLREERGLIYSVDGS